MPRKVNSWSSFLNEIDRARDELNCPHGAEEEAWFRGHTSSEFELQPSLFRHFNKPNGKKWEEVWATESDLFWEFSTRARELHGTTDSDWDLLFAMQHHGTPTRLLDWTEVLGVAVYFATLGLDLTQANQKSRTLVSLPCVWVLNPNQLNLASDWETSDLIYPNYLGWDASDKTFYSYGDMLLEDGIGWELPVAIYPRQKTARMHAQRAWFTIHGNSFKPLDKLKNTERYLRKVELPIEALPDARAFMVHAGLNHYSLFPDLDNLSKHLRQKYQLGSKGRF